MCTHHASLLLRVHFADEVGDEPIYSDEEEDGEESSEELELEPEENNDDDDDEEEEFDGRSEVSSAKGASPGDGSNRKRSGTPPPPKIDARARFAANLLLLNGVHLGQVIQMLEKQCPEALESSSSSGPQPPLRLVPEKLEIDLDKIEPSEVFYSIAQYAADHAVRRRTPVAMKITNVSNKRSKAK